MTLSARRSTPPPPEQVAETSEGKVRFRRIRIAGFKSFAEAASLDILPGLTGIVGPNGCGKSNVVEALRWAMGESSARSLRGDEMDDLIFAGTAARPSRNLAEVTLTLERELEAGPAELQVSRRIERGAGSAYRVDGREARARDVQTLFADIASGARSSAMVSQGRVSAIVNAGAEERRSILEEAAGITGLHARRREAELKLRATEANLDRAEDVRQHLQARLDELAVQSREAGRYRAVAGSLREAEGALLALLRARAAHVVETSNAAAEAAQGALAEAGRRVGDAAEAERQAEAALDPAHHAAAATGTELERQRVAAEALARDEARLAAEAAASLQRLARSGEEADAAMRRLHEAASARARVAGELEAAAALREALPARLHEAEQALDAAVSALARATADHAAALATRAQATIRGEQVARDLEAARLRLHRIEEEHAGRERERASTEAALPDEAALAAACDATDSALGRARMLSEQAEEQRIGTARASLAAEGAARASAAALVAERNAESLVLRLTAELAALAGQAAQATPATPAQHQEAIDLVAHAEAAFMRGRDELVAAEAARLAARRAHAEAGHEHAETERQHARHAQLCAAARTAASAAAARHAQRAREAADAQAALVPEATLRDAESALAAAETALRTARETLAAREAVEQSGARMAAEATRALAAARAEQARLEAEIDGLTRALGNPAESAAGWEALADSVPVPLGLERAVASVLAEGLQAALDEAAPRCWRDLGHGDEDETRLPAGVTPLSTLLAAPRALGRVLRHAGLIADADEADRLQASLAPGQCLVTREGGLWRWDGLRLADPLATDPGAALLVQRTRLREATARLEPVAADASALQARASVWSEAHAAQTAETAQWRGARDEAERVLARAREQGSALSARDAAARARLEAILPQCDDAVRQQAEAERALAEALAQQAGLPDMQSMRATLDAARAAEADAVAAEAAAAQAREAAESGLRTARDRHAALLARHAEAQSRLAALLPRQERLTGELETARAEAARAQAAARVLPPPGQAQAACTFAAEAATRAEIEAAALRQARADAEGERDCARAARAEAAAARTRLEALLPRLVALEGERQEAAARYVALQEEALALPDLDDATTASERARDALATAAQREAACREQRALRTAEASALRNACDSLEQALAERVHGEAAARQGEAEALTRLEIDRNAHDALARQPEQVARRRVAHAEALDEAGHAHAAAIAEAARAANALTTAQSAARQAAVDLAQARDEVLRQRRQLEQAEATLNQLPLEKAPQPEPRDFSDAAEGNLRRRIARLGREREEIGPVNLRAEIESDEMQARADAIAREREELETAIARLRGSIGQLNRDGRERLLTVFTAVDAHFQALFGRMFNGGRAHLALVGDDDPLSAGLELYAQPPGKKLAALSLLSGGEQALCALSLIFAVFRCNPAPICVLDEVDAPLDDANVGRFVALLADMAAETATRFLVVTHHQLTMAHMDRLYGVTMQERGVSRVLSVDLAAASGMVAPHAARAER